MAVGDYHVHSRFSIDSNEPMLNQCRAAIEAGITEIAFTEHIDHDRCDAESQAHYDYEVYRCEVERCRTKFAGHLTILNAAEIDFNHTIASDVERFLQAYEFDFIIGSVHNLNHVYVGSDTVESFGGPRNLYDRYLDEIELLVGTGFPDVIGHLDLPRRYHKIAMEDVDATYFEERVRRIFRLAAKNGVGFELNTSGLRRGVGTSHPSPEVISWFVQEGGEILTIGSDSHEASATGSGICRIQNELVQLGINWRTSFVNGGPERVEFKSI
jgi:histidinol-phosphatase (PHP family)